MASTPLIDDFLRLLSQPGTRNADLERWQRRFQAHLDQLSPAEAENEIRNMQAIVQENKVLFETEAASIVNTLAPKDHAHRHKANARRYSDVDKL